MDGRVMRHGIISSCQSAAIFRDCKALLDTSLTHVSSAVASTLTLTLTFDLFLVWGLIKIVGKPSAREDSGGGHSSALKALVLHEI